MNRYDDRARLVFHFAREEGSKLGHPMIGPEHILLGLMREGGTAARILSEFGATREGFRQRIEEVLGSGEGLRHTQAPIVTPRARRVMELASSEARNLGSEVINTEHILLGVLREGDGVAFSILQDLSRDVDTIRWRILAHAADSPAGAPEIALEREFMQALGGAYGACMGLEHERLGPEHLLLGLLAPGLRTAPVLAGFGVTPAGVRTTLGPAVDRTQGEPPLALETFDAIALATVEARRSGASTVGSRHLLLGLLEEESGRGRVPLERLGVDLGALRARLREP